MRTQTQEVQQDKNPRGRQLQSKTRNTKPECDSNPINERHPAYQIKIKIKTHHPQNTQTRVGGNTKKQEPRTPPPQKKTTQTISQADSLRTGVVVKPQADTKSRTAAH